MNDLEARRLLLADPRHLSPELREALEDRPALECLRSELLRQDESLRAAATAASVPEGLAERLVLGARYRKGVTTKAAIAALIVSVAIIASWQLTKEMTLELAMIDHVGEGVEELQDDTGVAEPVLRASLAGLGMDLREAPFRVRHLAQCVVAGVQGRHFTVDGPHGVVSFVLLPASWGLAPRSLMKGELIGVYERRGRFLIGAFGQAGDDQKILRRLMGQMFG